MPKSVSFACPFFVSITLSGLMSRWRIPLKQKKISFNRVIGDNMKDYSLIEIQKKQVFQLDVSVEDPLQTTKRLNAKETSVSA